MENKIKFRDIAFLLIGILLGVSLMLLWFYAFEIAFLNNFRVENIVIGLNETKMVDYIIQQVNATGV